MTQTPRQPQGNRGALGALGRVWHTTGRSGARLQHLLLVIGMEQYLL